MAKITITLLDTEKGGVKVDSEPHMTKLAEMARNKDLTAAQAYALKALAVIIKDSQENMRLELQAKFDAGQIPAYDATTRH